MAWDLHQHTVHHITPHLIPYPPSISVPFTGNSQGHLKKTYSIQNAAFFFFPKAPDVETRRYHSVYQTHGYSWRSVLKMCKLPAKTLVGKNHLLVLMEAIR